jgi:fructose-1,6-bisphosphatase II / sedoheptulose-1,7-bisphosphatase
MHDMASGDVSFAATGITDGSLLEGVRFTPGAIFTHTVVMRASTRTVRWIRTEHRDIDKFD